MTLNDLVSIIEDFHSNKVTVDEAIESLRDIHYDPDQRDVIRAIAHGMIISLRTLHK